MQESVFFQDMAVVMAIAGLAAALFSRFGWPKVFGYILVGILMNGHTWGGSFLTDTASISTLGQLGVIFLMLTMGLEFSASDMKRMKDVTVPIALIDTVVMVWLGYTVGTRILGWKTVPSLFLGTAICDSATTLLAKMIGELGWSRRPFVKYVLGTSVCEDMVCVGLIALVTGFANGSGMSLGAVGLSLGSLALFFLATLIFGLILVPRLLQSVAKRGDDESLLLTFLGICFFLSWVAYKKDFSLAIGAFLVGLLGASSEVKQRLHKLVMPMRSMFSAMFFVSIGLLVDPKGCLDNGWTILLVSATVLLGKGFNCFVGAILTGQTLKTAVQIAFSLAQIGEFAFMVALLYVGISRDVSSPMFQVTIGVSILTTLLNPLMIRLSDPVGSWVERKCPRRMAKWLSTYRAFIDTYQARQEAHVERRRVRMALVELGGIAIMELAVGAVFAVLDRVDWTRFSEVFERYDRYIFILLANVFFVAMSAPIIKVASGLANALNAILVGPGEAKWQAPVRGVVRLFVFAAVIGSFLVMDAMINAAMVPDHPSVEWGLFGVVILIGIVGWKFFKKASFRAKQRFDEALAIDDRLADLEKMLTIQVPADAINRLTLSPDSPAVGGTVVTLNIRAKTGASVVSVERDGHLTRNIGPEWVFRSGDVLIAMGEPSQIAALRSLLGIPC